MACNYYFKDVLIGDEFQLNDFLIKNRDLIENNQSDLVFQKSDAQRSSEKILFDHIKETNKLTHKIKRDNNTIDGEVEDKIEKPYIGVTEFLESFKSWDDSPLFPIFIDENYWFNKMNQWKDGLFADKEEVILLGTALDGNDVDQTVNQNGNSYIKGKPITDQYALNQAQKLLIEKWKVQNLAGIDVHEILRYYFSWDSENKRMRGDDKATKMRVFNKKIVNTNLSKKSIEDVLDVCERLKLQLRKQFPDCLFFPEFTVSAQLEDGRSILGRIDLVVIDKQGVPHIIDFKTSPKQYSQFNKAKVRTFYYQTAVYDRILRMLHLNTDRSTVSILPIQFTNFRRENDEFTWDNITVAQTENSSMLVDITVDINEEEIQQRINEFMPYPNFLEVEPGEVTKNVKELMTQWFSDVSEQVTEDTEIKNSHEFYEKVKEQIEPYITKNDETGNYIYKNKNAYSDPIIGKDVKEVVMKYIKKLLDRKKFREHNYNRVRDYIKQGVEQRSFKRQLY